MKTDFEFTSKEVKQKIEDAGLNGTEILQLIKDTVKPNKGVYYVWIKGKAIRLTLNNNIIINVWSQKKKL